MSYNLDGYVDVPTRMAAFYARFPEGSLQMDPPVFTEVLGKAFVWAQARAYRHPDDPRPGIGTAWEQIPGQTPYTRGSELMVLETSAWGRCIAAVMPVGDKIATAEEVKAAEDRRGPRIDMDQGAITVSHTSKTMGSYHTPSGKTIQRGDQPITEPQLKKLRYEMKRLAIEEVMLDDFAHDVYGFHLPTDGLHKLTKAHASTLIDGLTQQVELVTRTQQADPDDPWQVNH